MTETTKTTIRTGASPGWIALDAAHREAMQRGFEARTRERLRNIEYRSPDRLKLTTRTRRPTWRASSESEKLLGSASRLMTTEPLSASEAARWWLAHGAAAEAEDRARVGLLLAQESEARHDWRAAHPSELWPLADLEALAPIRTWSAQNRVSARRWRHVAVRSGIWIGWASGLTSRKKTTRP